MLTRWFNNLLLFVAVILSSGAFGSDVYASSKDERCFLQTQQCISGRIREYWEQQGGLPVFGYPLEAAKTEKRLSGDVVTQLFERHRIEYTPLKSRPYDVQLGRLGAEVYLSVNSDAPTVTSKSTHCLYFSVTKQSICGDILSEWKARGIEIDGKRGYSFEENLALNGYPISPLMSSTSENIETRVQWFERGRIESAGAESIDSVANVFRGLFGYAAVSRGLVGSEANATSTLLSSKVVTRASTAKGSTAKGNTAKGNTAKAEDLYFGGYVTKVVDGDTIHMEIDGDIYKIRMIGIDTPETKDPRKPVQCYGEEASNYARSLLEGKVAVIELDPSQGWTDKYGRILAYVWTETDDLYNWMAIYNGYAFEYTYSVPYAYQADFKGAQNHARQNSVGLWAADTCNGVTTSSTSSSTSPGEIYIPAPSSGSNSGQRDSNSASSPCFVGQVKGNANSGIYHVPGGSYYARTYANVECFDTEQQARNAGYRRSQR
jgi:endonuclease YncB( thermonuclease family)